jgi:hypothetical protein
MAKTIDPRHCRLYKPGHQVHYIQARVKRSAPRYAATVSYLGPDTIRVDYNGFSLTRKHHNAIALAFAALQALDQEVEFAPDAELLYIKRENPNDQHGGVWALFYLCEGELVGCVGWRG